MSDDSQLKIIHNAIVKDAPVDCSNDFMDLKVLLDSMENLDHLIEHHLANQK